MSLLSRVVTGICAIALAAAQSSQPAQQQPEITATKPAEIPAKPAEAASKQAETTTKEEPATFKARVNLVMVPVVVRDKAGRAVGSLKQEDFQLFDKGKPQFISRFSLEKSGVAPAEKGAKPPKSETADAPLEMPERYVAYLFDDIHISSADLMRSRDAAWKFISTSLRPTDRAAIYTTSGRDIIEFTDDKDKIHDLLMRLVPHPIDTRAIQKCPDVGYYLADLIQNKNDPMALQAAVAETMACAQLDPTQITVAQSMVRGAAAGAVAVGDQESRLSLGLLRDIIRRMGILPGQRSITLVSPGFIIPQLEQELTDVMDRAIKANVTINSLDARGLWTDPLFDASHKGYSVQGMAQMAQYPRAEAAANADVLAALAYGTGGNFFENNNDLEEGFRKLTGMPEYMYLLGFSPQNLKLDGSFHSLKVTIKAAGLTASARKGYYAPRHLSDPAETAREELREAIFSREELKDLPVTIHTQFFKPSNETARVTVVASIDLKQLRFRMEGDRHRNDLTIVAALFDRNGNWVTGSQKLVEMRLKDATLERPAASGFTIRTTFDVKPGGYLVRLVVRDAEGQQMAAQNGTVEIP
jgi:VWFA-related protein